MPERRDERLVSVDKFGSGFGNSPTKNRCLFVITLNQVTRLHRGYQTMTDKALWGLSLDVSPAAQGVVRLTYVTVGQGTKRPHKRQIGVDPKSPLEIMQRRIEIFLEE